VQFHALVKRYSRCRDISRSSHIYDVNIYLIFITKQTKQNYLEISGVKCARRGSVLEITNDSQVTNILEWSLNRFAGVKFVSRITVVVYLGTNGISGSNLFSTVTKLSWKRSIEGKTAGLLSCMLAQHLAEKEQDETSETMFCGFCRGTKGRILMVVRRWRRHVYNRWELISAARSRRCDPSTSLSLFLCLDQ